jgi:hypothetical protein
MKFLTVILTIFLVDSLFPVNFSNEENIVDSSEKISENIKKDLNNSSKTNVEAILFFVSLSFVLASTGKLEDLGYLPNSSDVFKFLCSEHNVNNWNFSINNFAFYDLNHNYLDLNLNLGTKEKFSVNGARNAFNILYGLIHENIMEYNILNENIPTYNRTCIQLHKFFSILIEKNDPEMLGTIKTIILELNDKDLLVNKTNKEAAWIIMNHLVYYALPHWSNIGLLSEKVEFIVNSPNFIKYHPLYLEAINKYMF